MVVLAAGRQLVFLLFGCVGGWTTASFLVGSESNEDFQGFGAWKRASFLMGSEGDVRQWGPLPAGPRRPCGPCCLGVAEPPLLSLGDWKTASFRGV